MTNYWNEEELELLRSRIAAIQESLALQDSPELSSKLHKALKDVQTHALELLNSERSFRESTRTMRSVLESIDHGVILSDLNGCPILFNSAANKMLSLSNVKLTLGEWPEKLGLFKADGVTLYDAQDLPLARAIQGVEIRTVEIFVRRDNMQDGIWLTMSAKPLTEESGNLKGAVAVLHDVTMQRLSEQMLKESECKVRTIIEKANDAFIAADSHGLITEWNQKAEETFGWSRSEVIGKALYETIIPARFRKSHHEGLRLFLENDQANLQSKRMEIICLHHDGHEFPAELSIFPIQATDGYMLCLFLHDISYRNRIEQRRAALYGITRVLDQSKTLKEAANKILQTTCETTGWDIGTIWQLETDGCLHCVDLWLRPWLDMPSFKAATELSLLAHGEGLPGHVLVSGRPLWVENIGSKSRTLRSGIALSEGFRRAFAMPLLCDDKVVGVIDFLGKEMKAPDGDLLTWFAAIGSQIGQFIKQKQAEHARTQLVAIVEYSRDAIIGKTLDGIITSFNPGAEKLYGYSQEEIIGKSVQILVPTERSDELSDIIESIKSGKAIEQYETVRVTKEGKFIDVSVTISPVRDENNNIIGATVTARDITERKHWETETKLLNQSLAVRVRELAKLNHDLDAVSGRLAEARDQALTASRFKSEFLANMSHEIRTPMNAVIGMADLLLRTTLTAEQLDFATVIRDSASNLLDIINDILDFSKIEAGKLGLQLREFDLVSVVEGVADILADKARQKDLSLMTFVSEDIPQSLRGDPGRIRQVLLNLLSNAIKFTEKGEVSIRAILESITDNQATIKLSVTDTGIGISSWETERIFEPFVQTDKSIARKYGGSGLGLSISKRLVHLMNGQIGLESKDLVGSTFWFSLPLEIDRSTKNKAKQQINNISVLYVGNSMTAFEIIQSYCASWGLTCNKAPNGQVTSNLFREKFLENKPYDIIIVQSTFPDIDGLQIAQKILQNENPSGSPQLIIFSLKGDRGQAERAIQLGCAAYITGPLKRSSLYDAFIKTLGHPSEQLTEVKSRRASDQPITVPETSLFELILVAEDNPVNRKVALLQLKHLGFKANAVSNGKEAIEALANTNYSLILMDCQMPEMDGFEATRQIRKMEIITGRHIPIIAMTAHAMQGDREKCIASGMDDYITKPVHAPRLQEMLQRWFPQTKSSFNRHSD